MKCLTTATGLLAKPELTNYIIHTTNQNTISQQVLCIGNQPSTNKKDNVSLSKLLKYWEN